MNSFDWAYHDEIDIKVTIDWSRPMTHDMLNYGMAKSDEFAYFYSIIGYVNKAWWPYYIGMVYKQSVSERHENPDHKKKLNELKSAFPEITWHLTLGTPDIKGKRLTKKLIESVEGLLIYSNWQDEMVNKSKINKFNSDATIEIINTGFSDPFYTKTGFGVFISD